VRTLADRDRSLSLTAAGSCTVVRPPITPTEMAEDARGAFDDCDHVVVAVIEEVGFHSAQILPGYEESMAPAKMGSATIARSKSFLGVISKSILHHKNCFLVVFLVG
jgi:hypothetical protein